jgi:uncharacterized repeat protein (TIGR03803 family)
LTADSFGALYGTANGGGANHKGAVFKLTPHHITNGTWTETIPYSFAGGSDGYSPVGSLLAGPNHAFYGRLPLAVADQVVLVGAEIYQPAILCEGLKWLAIPWHSLLP